ncbi:SDR family NAD(P)-dependent oxidoreductase [Cohnella yongneupensis]|uniref:SDR family NAD(P)-dependent oxidoreductase n=1 Tax=Cohnella yongneupensis TaxID=425006 RepID=A0ABW0QZ85_9BACL
MDIRKKALVTGASRGIGKGIALAFAEAGYDLTICHWNDEDNAKECARQIREEWGRECFVLSADLAEADAAVPIVVKAWARMGHIDVIVNNAGICIFQDTVDLTVPETDKLFRVNFRAPLLLMREVARLMIGTGIRGSLLNITSSRAERAYPKDAVYGGLKAGLKRASESVALDLAPHGIRVNCIAPGATLVRANRAVQERLGPRIPLGRMAMPADIGQAAVWLASEQASYTTGIQLRIDGGLILPGTPET